MGDEESRPSGGDHKREVPAAKLRYRLAGHTPKVVISRLIDLSGWIGLLLLLLAFLLDIEFDEWVNLDLGKAGDRIVNWLLGFGLLLAGSKILKHSKIRIGGNWRKKVDELVRRADRGMQGTGATIEASRILSRPIKRIAVFTLMLTAAILVLMLFPEVRDWVRSLVGLGAPL